MAVAVRRAGDDLPIRRGSTSCPRCPVNLWAISDLHVGYEENRRAVEALERDAGRLADHRGRHRRDAGAPRLRAQDAARRASRRSSGRSATTICGRRERWPTTSAARRTTSASSTCAAPTACSRRKIPYAVWPGDGPRTAIVPTFVLYDYSFRPDDVAGGAGGGVGGGVGRALRRRAICSSPAPFASRPAWCRARDRRDRRRGSTRSRPTRASCWSTTGRCAATTRCCRASRASRSGAARAPPRSGIARYPDRHRRLRPPAPPRARASSTACASRKCRSAIRGSGIRTRAVTTCGFDSTYARGKIRVSAERQPCTARAAQTCCGAGAPPPRAASRPSSRNRSAAPGPPRSL